MKCQNAEKLILLQDARQTEELAAHLNSCPNCREFQQVLIKSQKTFQPQEEPSATTVQNVLRAARVNAHGKRPAKIFGLKPALAMAASVIIGLGIFFSVFGPDKVGMELVVAETQLLEHEDQVVSVMYDGLSEDDLAFNFLMTYEEG